MISIAGIESEIVENRLRLSGQFVVEMAMPEQDERLPDIMERMTLPDARGFGREIYRLRMEVADRQLVLSKRAGKDGEGIQLIGKRTLIFKTLFGRVPVARTRIRHKADGSTQIPAHHAWRTPKQVVISAGLKMTVTSIVTKESYRSTVRQIERETGSPKIISKSTVSNILHQTGAALQQAQQERAAAVYEQDETAGRVLLKV